MKTDGGKKAAVLPRSSLYEMHVLAVWTRWNMFHEMLKTEEHIFYISSDGFAQKQKLRCIWV